MSDINPDLQLVLKAAFYSGEKHKNQRRRDVAETPYINHPLEVAYILMSEGGVTDAATLAAALLHDTIEDTNTTREELLMVFGREVSELVVELTDLATTTPEDKKRRELEHAYKLSDKAKRIKLADKTANIRDLSTMPPANWDLHRKICYFEFAARIVEATGDASPELVSVFLRDYNHFKPKSS
jgi:guanosine-3',5'-bis(diphosphate) 3'-pyrophosphohydrolase